MADLITLRPALLTYRNRVVLDGVVIYLGIQYRARTNDWFLSVFDAQQDPIVQGVRVQVGLPLLRGLRDERLPPGKLLAGRDGSDFDLPRQGEFGGAVKLFYIRQADIDEALEDLDAPAPGSLVAPQTVLEVT